MTYGQKLESAMKAKDLTVEKVLQLTGLERHHLKRLMNQQFPLTKYYPKTNRLIAILDVDRNGDPILHRGNGPERHFHETTALKNDSTGFLGETLTPTQFNQVDIRYADQWHEGGLDRRTKKYAIVEVGSGRVVSRF